MSRERRTQLEQIQDELKRARATVPPAISALEDSLVEAIRMADAASGMVESLKAKRRETSIRILELKQELEEESLLARGRSRRHYYVDWARAEWVLVLAGAVIAAFVVILLGLGWSP